MTTPDTSAVRAWAKENGYEVAGRGRLPADVVQAYLAATKPAKKAATKPAKKAPAKRASSAKAPAEPVAPEPAAPAVAEPEETPELPRTPQPKPSLVGDDRRLVALGEEIAALSKRVEALEKAAGSKSGGGKAPRFLRRS